ncbi:hypothetical protein L6452_20669 [Arctium lappa]|uniref:Uncharacterized protein n=1 Tax=Arctium lappa TaxID=4217 RepID=A0ACB9BC18_ARCLA|nr:hypothetical protein L6452_20669 [Arctium lappa]
MEVTFLFFQEGYLQIGYKIDLLDECALSNNKAKVINNISKLCCVCVVSDERKRQQKHQLELNFVKKFMH